MNNAPSYVERFLVKIEYAGLGYCWLWSGWKTNKGYGMFLMHDKNRLAHRVAYEILRGPIPPGLHIDHLCRTPSCVNPDHLEPVTQRVNTMRGRAPSARHAVKVVCLRGHNDWRRKTKSDPSRKCMTCKREQGRNRYYRLRDAARQLKGPK